MTATPGRVFLREGVLKKDSTQALIRNVFKARAVYLFNDLLVWTTVNEPSAGHGVVSGKCRGYIALSGPNPVALQSRADKLPGFIVATKDRILGVVCDSAGSASVWKAEIAAAIEAQLARKK